MKVRQRYFSTKQDAEDACAKIGCDYAGIKIMSEKNIFLTNQISNISSRAAIICKQEMMALGGEVVLPKDVMASFPKDTTIIISGTQKQYKRLCQKLYQQPFGCKAIAQRIEQTIQRSSAQEQEWKLQNKTLHFSKPIIIGIVNITPDSFSDGNRCFNKKDAIRHSKELMREGADILDIGGESTRPGSEPVPVREELERVLPVLDALVADKKVIISIDTYKPEVAEECLKHGAHIMNDITGMKNPSMRIIAAKYDVPVIIMHMQGTPKTMQANPVYNDVVDDILDFFETQIALCKKEGMTRFICDPGIGFGKTVEQNLEILKRFREFKILGVPLLVGTSRKSFIEKTIGGAADDRLEGTIASNVIAAMYGCNIFRVHDVNACKRALTLTKRIQEAK